jgi:hypothetical protein
MVAMGTNNVRYLKISKAARKGNIYAGERDKNQIL